MKNRIVPALLLSAAALLLSSCDDLATFMSNLDDDVKTANDRYLEVVNLFPEQNDNNLSPRTAIEVQLDRDIDIGDITEYVRIQQRGVSGETIPYVDPESEDGTGAVTMDYNPTDNILTITPEPFFQGGDKVIITLIRGMPALDGALLKDDVSWSFYTVKMPVGVVDIADGDELAANDHALPGYTNDATPVLSIAYSNADQYYITDDPDDQSYEVAGFTGWEETDPTKSGEKTVPDAEFSFNWSGHDAEEKTLYVVFRDSSTDTLSIVESDSVYFDEDPPTGVSCGSSVYSWTNESVERTLSYHPGEDSTGSGVYKAEWRSDKFAEFSDPSAFTTGITGPPGETVENLDASARVFDRAGNPSSWSSDITIDWDNEGPDSPTNLTVNYVDGADKPEWTWSQAADDNGGVGTIDRYYYSYKGGTWTNTTANSFQVKDKFTRLPVPLPDGKYTFRIRQYDDLYNLSSTGYEDIIINEAGISPYDTQADVAYLAGQVLSWPDASGLTISYAWALYASGGTKPLEAGTSSSAESAPLPALAPDTEYEWQYRVYSRGTLVFTSPRYSFTTRRFKF